MITIFKATTRHLNDLTLLFDAYRIFYKKESDLDGAKEFLKQRLTKKQSVVFMAYEGPKAAGFAPALPELFFGEYGAFMDLKRPFCSP